MNSTPEDGAIGHVGLIAGGGPVPDLVVQAAQSRGIPITVVALKGFAEPSVQKTAEAEVGLGEIGRVTKLLKAAQCDSVIMVGLVTRPDFSSLKLDWGGMKLLPKVIAAARNGDDALLRALATSFEDEGFRVIGADDVATGMLVEEGPLGRHQPSDEDHADIERAWSAARMVGEADIGQGAVSARGLVLALEAQEGTDAMLARVADLPASLRGTDDTPVGVLAKAKKPIQDRRLDLPTCGPRTVAGAQAAHLRGIVLEAGASLLVDREKTIADADAAGMFILGYATQQDAET